MHGVAELLELSYSTIRGYHGLATQRRRDGETRPGDFPEPDYVFGQAPVWKEATIRRWQHYRPGRGAGGGRPRKETVT